MGEEGGGGGFITSCPEFVYQLDNQTINRLSTSAIPSEAKKQKRCKIASPAAVYTSGAFAMEEQVQSPALKISIQEWPGRLKHHIINGLGTSM